MPFSCLVAHARGVSLQVKAVPRSSRTEIVDFQEDRCRIKVRAPPVEGEANAALVAFLAKVFSLPKSRVLLERGARGKQKNFLLVGVDPMAAQEALKRASPPGSWKENE
ncbi:hypothetical protein AUK22_01115 [bacterium CG2_30_54_10]|nr:MAG: hypothetical protein AUK22_01115 [bacterium CG2_30_54_10]